MQRFKLGQEVRVVNNFYCHEFKIGEVVKVERFYEKGNSGKGDYKCSNKEDFWYLLDEELEELTEQTTNK
jgi:hypothetical protein